MSLLLVAGLGNPGLKYTRTPHNAGFGVVQRLAESSGGAVNWRDRFRARIAEVLVAGSKALLMMPQTFMNASGEAVQQAASFYRLQASDVVVIHDELDLPLGSVKLKRGGGDAGHNGLRSVSQHLGPEYIRVRVGVGRPAVGTPKAYLLRPLDADSWQALDAAVAEAAGAVELLMGLGLDRAMNAVNARAKNTT